MPGGPHAGWIRVDFSTPVQGDRIEMTHVTAPSVVLFSLLLLTPGVTRMPAPPAHLQSHSCRTFRFLIRGTSAASHCEELLACGALFEATARPRKAWNPSLPLEEAGGEGRAAHTPWPGTPSHTRKTP
jgi:hypothetical protein